MNAVGKALRDVFTRAVDKAIPVTPGKIRPGDTLHQAFARQLGIPVLKPPEIDPADVERVKPNRADRRARRSGPSIRANRGSDYTPRTSPRGAYRGPVLPRASKVARYAAQIDAIETSIANHPAGKAQS